MRDTVDSDARATLGTLFAGLYGEERREHALRIAEAAVARQWCRVLRLAWRWRV